MTLDKKKTGGGLALVMLALALAVGGTNAQQPDAEKEIERYRAMISDPFSNPAFLNVDRGEILWKTARGTKNGPPR